MKTPILLKSLYLFFCLSPFAFRLMAQTIPVGTPLLEDFLRRQQLLGKTDSTLSFTIRPIFPVNTLKISNSFDPDSSLFRQREVPLEGIVRFGKNFGVIQILPVVAQFQYNTHHPYSLNDGAMIPAKGFQMLTSAGIYAKFGPLSFQFNPEFVYARNDSFPGFPEAHSDAVWKAWHSYYSGIDMPERFGNLPWAKSSWGQSSVRLTAGPVSLGLSNENLWWGPGMRNTLLMTNTAPGFKHLTFNSIRPIKTPIGSFEFQLVAGKLDSSGYALPSLVRNGLTISTPKVKPNDWVYFNGIVLNYSPRWVPGLYLGACRSFIVYRGDMGNQLNDYLPVIIPLSKVNTGGQAENDKRRDQLASLFVRWVLFKANAEIYFEYGREDHAWDIRDLILQPEHSHAYVFGFRKLVPIKRKKDQFIEVNLEISDLDNSRILGARDKGTWYVHSQVTQGYTHVGQILGASIGPGSNMQTLSLNWIKGMKKIGLEVERYTHNNEFQYWVIKNIRSNWVDLSTSVVGEWDFRNFLVRAKIDEIISFNYQHLFVPLDPADTDFWTPAKNTYNLQVQLGVVYRW